VINFKDPKDQLPSGLAIAGMLGLAVSAVNLYFVTPNNKRTLAKETKSKTSEMMNRYKQAKEDIELTKSKVGLHLWEARVDDVTPVALAKISRMSKTNQVTLVSFRPQKPTEGTVLVQQPYVLTVDGPFTNVANLIDAIEKSDNRLAVSQIQFAATEGESDVVSAQIGLIAYLNRKEAPAKVNVSNQAKSNPAKSQGVTSRG
jgi:Tfp pilus assembly protein PilO